ncbi:MULTISPECIES: gp16 family protein [unclassified Neisseria]|uniref:gp16 family protein n=1 Tax=unclassified Neisseria TaxID=2623750 RepID=UPI0010718020|nr:MULTISPECIES: regulatory protein GemA [unclassified Neisseria]MBF0802914.1 regulatory protein GemA [Neisseria sp. 19428wB4_WF04]TFU44448.1 regulatory protein GemA [Neisseria sp. WF04]
MKETKAQKKARLIKLIHVAKGQLMMDDAAYRTLLANASRGKTSSKALSVDELEWVLRQLKAQGFVVATKAQAKQDKPDIPVYDAGGQIRKIRALWLQLHAMGEVRNASELSLARFVKRMTGVDYHGWLDADNASKVIEHLKQWVVRVGGNVA